MHNLCESAQFIATMVRHDRLYRKEIDYGAVVQKMESRFSEIKDPLIKSRLERILKMAEEIIELAKKVVYEKGSDETEFARQNLQKYIDHLASTGKSPVEEELLQAVFLSCRD